MAKKTPPELTAEEAKKLAEQPGVGNERKGEDHEVPAPDVEAK